MPLFTTPGTAQRSEPLNSLGKLRNEPAQQQSEDSSGIRQVAHPDKTLSGGNAMTSNSMHAPRADYGVIFLFDGVSTVVPIIQKKLGYPPTVVVLAEIDTSLRSLVCSEFGYRTAQTWGRTKNESVCIYVKDVNSLFDDHCRLLHEAVALAPNAKWIIVGGSPCQDLTFAGAFKGQLGLVGKNSRLFFTLLGTIRAMQELVKVQNVRFLVENAGSMVDLHYQAFCQLLGLSPEPKSRYLWDPADHGFGITRKRIFFRGHDDCQEISEPQGLNLNQGGPILLQPNKPITLPPLLRTRSLLQFEVCWSSMDAVSTMCFDLGLWILGRTRCLSQAMEKFPIYCGKTLSRPHSSSHGRSL